MNDKLKQIIFVTIIIKGHIWEFLMHQSEFTFLKFISQTFFLLEILNIFHEHDVFPSPKHSDLIGDSHRMPHPSHTCRDICEILIRPSVVEK
jgi:hypothetical protein